MPITAQVQGDYPVRVMMLNVTVQPLDGSPALEQAVQFAANPNLGAPALTSQRGRNNYAGAWLNSTAAGLRGSNVVVGELRFVVPTNASQFAAYAIHFEHVSASPNGIAPFRKRVRTGLVTLADRSSSSWGDGIPDAWRLRHFGSINNVLSATTADADGDGLNNMQEFMAGTDPNDSSSHFKLMTGRNPAQSQGIVIKWPSAVGKRYVVEVSPTVFGPVWVPVATNTGTGWDIEYRDTNPGQGPRFYRVRLLN
ncbi:MAG: thrombospondin type 3 repeat-containing protein [Verrucomicrobiales bacterium]|nr:thrombospondin type 3 repeat-containing protein [Verrucomicrobiales bacterium]